MDQAHPFEFQVSRAELAAAFEPFVQRRFEPGDLGWKRRVLRTGIKKSGAYWKHKVLSGLEKPQAPQHKVKQAYEQQWQETRLSQQLSAAGKRSACVWGTEHMLASGIGLKRVHHSLLIRAFETIQPASVLEVGCGNGLNLFVLAGHFRHLHFSGIELSHQGVAAAHRVCEQSRLPDEILAFADGLIVDPSAHQRLDIRQGSAQSLPFAAHSFDVVFTVMALEAMEEIRHAALRELARVARQYVIMVEPFLDFNTRGIRSYHHASHNYFQAKVEELPYDRLEPLLVYTDMPHRLRLRPALVIARPIEAA
jgi:ubiquinone/menaquinone biosynthesis C-methylase UbiE